MEVNKIIKKFRKEFLCQNGNHKVLSDHVFAHSKRGKLPEEFENFLLKILDFQKEAFKDECLEQYGRGQQEGFDYEKYQWTKEIEGMRRELKDMNICRYCGGSVTRGNCDCNGYNQALEDILKKLNEKKNNKT